MTGSSKYPIYLKEPNSLPPEAESYYIIAKNGLFLHKKQNWVRAVVPVDNICILEEEEARAELLLPALPEAVLIKAVKLAKMIYDDSQSEVCLLLHHNQETGYELTVPPQEVGPGFVHYSGRQRLPGYACVGTIHSHGSMRAYHSSTDHRDEADFDGVHATIGCLDCYPNFSFSAEVVVNDKRFPLDFSWFDSLIISEVSPYFSYKYYHHSSFYTLSNLESDEWQVPEEWLANVKAKKFSWLDRIMPKKEDAPWISK